MPLDDAINMYAKLNCIYNNKPNISCTEILYVKNIVYTFK